MNVKSPHSPFKIIHFLCKKIYQNKSYQQSFLISCKINKVVKADKKQLKGKNALKNNNDKRVHKLKLC